MIKRLGHDVHILEKSLSSLQSGQAAGIRAGPDVQKFLDRYDLTGQPYSISSPGVQMINNESKVRRFFQRSMQLTGWSTLYYRLRANFDGLASQHCLAPPPASDSDGKAVFDVGKKVTAMEYADQVITVVYQDQFNHQNGSLQADLVVAADGFSSIVHQELLPELTRTYAGYVAWRGTVVESELSEEHHGVFSDRVTVFKCPNNYVLGYTIPGDGGSLKPGERLLNYVWYSTLPEDSPKFANVMTDTDGHIHRQTVPVGKMRAEVWAAQKEYGRSILASVFVELVHKTKQPFISAVSDHIASQAVFFEDRLFLVGDALSLFRPHIALSTNQSALHCLLLEKVLSKRMPASTWESIVLRYGRANRLLSNVLGAYGLGGIWDLLRNSCCYVREIVKQRILGVLGH
ncbi:MAG: hypothetical protein Q9167_007003 [Letrouitia subvulpina]